MMSGYVSFSFAVADSRARESLIAATTLIIIKCFSLFLPFLRKKSNYSLVLIQNTEKNSIYMTAGEKDEQNA